MRKYTSTFRQRGLTPDQIPQLSSGQTTQTFEKLSFMKTTRSKIDPQSDDKRVKKLEKEYDNFLHKEDHLKAFGCLEKILLLEPNSYFGFLREGDIFHHFERDDEALKSYKKCIKLDRKDGRAQNNMGNVFQNQKQFKDRKSTRLNSSHT